MVDKEPVDEDLLMGIRRTLGKEYRVRFISTLFLF